MTHSLHRLWKENRGLILFMLLMVFFRSAVADWNHVPTGSMIPTIVEGDRVFINKLAYDVKVPFTLLSLAKLNDPQRGDIIIFESEVADLRLVKRVIGLPGDVISMQDNRLSLNGVPLDYHRLEHSPGDTSKTAGTDYIEQLQPGIDYRIRTRHNGRAASFAPLLVPENHYFVLGDNRDNSADSRYIGFVPRHELIGRSRSVVMSLDSDNYYLPRKTRFFQRL